MPDEPRYGPVEAKARQDVGHLITAHPMAETLAEMAYTLARALDDGAGLATAAINRELRANLDDLAAFSAGDDENLDDELSQVSDDRDDQQD